MDLSRSAPEPARGRVTLIRSWPSLNRIILWGRVLLIGQMMVPIIAIDRDLLAAGDSQGAALLALCCGLYILWNLYFLEESLRAVPSAHGEPSTLLRTRKLVIFGGQLAFALTCQYLGRAGVIEGSKQYFWMPLAIFVPLLTRRARSLIAGGIVPVILATVFEWYLQDGQSALLWLWAHFCVTGFIFISLLGVGELGKLGRALSQLADELDIANRVLEQQSHHVVQLAIAEERNRLARDMHDALGHSLTVVTAQLEAASELLQRDPDRARQAILKAQTSSRTGLEEIRRSLRAMRSAALEDRDLVEALKILLETFERPNTHLTLSVLGTMPHLSGHQEESLFRCAQEAVTNAMRHAQADCIALELDFNEVNFARLQIKDNGRGFTPDAIPGNGIRGLRERAQLLRGTLSYATASEGGATCELKFPLP